MVLPPSNLVAVGRPADHRLDAVAFLLCIELDRAEQRESERETELSGKAGQKTAVQRRHPALGQFRIGLVNLIRQMRFHFSVKDVGIDLPRLRIRTRGRCTPGKILVRLGFVCQLGIINHSILLYLSISPSTISIEPITATRSAS